MLCQVLKRAVYLMKTPFQLHNILLRYTIFQGVCMRTLSLWSFRSRNIFMRKIMLKNFTIFVLCCEGKTTWRSHFPSGDSKIFQPPVGAWLKKVMPLKLITLRGLKLFWGQLTVMTYLCFWSKLFFVGVKQNTKFFQFKTKPIPRMPVQDAKSSLKILGLCFQVLGS